MSYTSGLFGQPISETPIQQIDALISSVWNDYEIKPSPDATDSQWCRRIFLDVLGRIPNVDELNSFLDSRSKTKRIELVETLLHDDKYAKSSLGIGRRSGQTY